MSRARKLLPNEQKSGRPVQWDAPGCCDRAGLLICWYKGAWVTEVRNRRFPVTNCPFCGAKLTGHTPARKN